jgi:CheY-like chemotaxis protein
MDDLSLKNKTLIVVDDEADLRDIVSSELEFMGATVYQAENITVAKSFLESRDIDLVISDIRMPGGTGIDLLKYVKAKDINVPPVVLITGFADVSMEDAFSQGAESMLSKPFKLEELIRVAVNLTAPVEERFKYAEKKIAQVLQLDFDMTLSEKINLNECAIGRGGISLIIDSGNFNLGIGDILKFDIKFKDIEIKGSAVCRWWKTLNQEDKSVVGLEFLDFDQATYQYFNNYWDQHQIIPFIPALH